MKLTVISLLVGFWMTIFHLHAQAEAPLLSLRTDTNRKQFQLHLERPDALVRKGVWLELQRSYDLEHWESLTAGPSFAFIDLDSSLLFEEPSQGQAFFRLLINHKVTATASSGEAIFGFSQSFAFELNKVGQLSVETFLERYSDASEKLPAIDFDPKESQFWNEFNEKPVRRVPSGDYTQEEGRLIDFQLNDEELGLFTQNGMVVSGRLGAHSFVDAYYGIFTEDLPVFVTSDSIMHAWHKTYIEMLSEIEATYLAPKLRGFLVNLHDVLPDLASELKGGVLSESLNDVDFYLTVARSLFSSHEQNSKLGQVTDSVQAVLKAIENRTVGPFSLFGRSGDNAWMDFSQFEVRGHYTSTPGLSKYFQAAMWCGRIDFRVAGPNEFSSPRELGAAIILNELVRRTESLQQWKDFDEILKVYVGVSDSMGFDQLAMVLKSAGLDDPADVDSLETLEAVQASIESGDFGFQQILSHPFVATSSGPSLVLPRSFTVFGQKFVMDSWALGQLVFDKVLWDNNKLPRRLPSALDVAFTVFGNRNAADLLAERIQRSDGVPFRDGYQIQHHLAALHEVFNQVPDTSWQDNIYIGWLKALRELSLTEGSVSNHRPQAFQTKAWANRVMNSQLGSWTELRHDTVLYVKQSSSPPLVCSFPFSYVEPIIGFWEAMVVLSRNTASKLSDVDASGSAQIQDEWGGVQSIRFQEIISKQVAHLQRFKTTMERLLEIAKKQQACEELDSSQITYLKNMVEIMPDYIGARTYSGWYPQLFYTSLPSNFQGPFPSGHPSDAWDPLVADVHTDFPDHVHGDPGTILLEGVGNVAMMLVAIDCEDADSRVFAGPTYTHYEFTSGEGEIKRMTDAEWKVKVKANNVPLQPEWTQDFFIPGEIRVPVWATAENGFP